MIFDSQRLKINQICKIDPIFAIDGNGHFQFRDSKEFNQKITLSLQFDVYVCYGILSHLHLNIAFVN